MANDDSEQQKQRTTNHHYFLFLQIKESTDQTKKSFIEKHDINVQEKKKKTKKLSGIAEEVEVTPPSKKKSSKKAKDGLVQTTISFDTPNRKSKSNGVESSPTKKNTSDSDTANKKQKKQKAKETSPPPPPAPVQNKKRKRSLENESDFASPKRHVLAASPLKNSSATKKQRKESTSSTRSSSITRSDNEVPHTQFKREQSVEINDVETESPPIKPPGTLYDYYVLSVHKGRKDRAKTVFEAQSKAERKLLSKEYNSKVEQYVVRLKSYLSSLSKQDAVKFVSTITHNFNLIGCTT